MPTRIRKRKPKALRPEQLAWFDRFVEWLSQRTADHLRRLDDHYLKKESHLSDEGQRADRFFEIASGDLTVTISCTVHRNDHD